MPTYTQQWIKWDEANFTWNDNPYTWNEVFILIEVADAVFNNGGGYIQGSDIIRHLDKDKKQRLIKLRTKVAGYKQTEDSKVADPNIDLTVDDIALLVNKMFSFTVDIESFKKMK